MLTLDRIEQLVKEKGWSNSEFLRRVNLPSSTFTDWKSGRHKSYEKHLHKIADVLGVSTDYLLGRIDDPNVASNTSEDELLSIIAGLPDDALREIKDFAMFVREKKFRKEKS